MASGVQDQWARWLLQRRFGGNPDALRAQMADLYEFRDQVLRNAAPRPGETVLDVGAGDGLIAFGALDRVGPAGTVIFSDISQDLLDHSRRLASDLGLERRCRFLRASADDLSSLADSAVDVVTTRSVLIYVADKRRALAEFYRVLRSGGRISLFEPINRYFVALPGGRYETHDLAPIRALADKVQAVFRRRQPIERDPMMDFDERDLLLLAEEAGFRSVRLDLQVHIEPPAPQVWDTYVNRAMNPLIPTLAEAMQEALTLEEVARFTEHLRPLVERGTGRHRLAFAYLWAVK